MTTFVAIYKTTKVATQSGKGKANHWCVEFKADEMKKQDPITGWYGSGDTAAHRKLYFETQDQAVTYCDDRGFQYTVEQPATQIITPKSYADNFLKFR